MPLEDDYYAVLSWCDLIDNQDLKLVRFSNVDDRGQPGLMEHPVSVMHTLYDRVIERLRGNCNRIVTEGDERFEHFYNPDRVPKDYLYVPNKKPYLANIVVVSPWGKKRHA